MEVLQALLEVSQAGQVLVELPGFFRCQSRLEGLDVGLDEVEHRPALEASSLCGAFGVGVLSRDQIGEYRIEGFRRVDHLGQRATARSERQTLTVLSGVVANAQDQAGEPSFGAQSEIHR